MTSKTITITLPENLLNTLKELPVSDNPEHAIYAGRKLSNICALLLAKQLQNIHEKNMLHLIK